MILNKSNLVPAIALFISIFSTYTFAHSKGDVLIRGGVGAVVPNESSNDPNGFGELSLNNDVNIAGTVSYMISDNFGVEVLLGLPFTHEVSAANYGAVADVSHLPLSVAAQYYFLEKNSTIRPYVGAGFNYTTFLDEQGKGALNNIPVSVDNSFGYALQAGLDFTIKENWFANISLWYLDIETKVHVDTPGASEIDIIVDPLALMMAIGYKF